jgi:hypothetical protein
MREFMFPIYVAFVFFLPMLIFIADTMINEQEVYKSCEKLGMEYYYSSKTHYCIDNNDNAHYIKLNCQGFLNTRDCTARIITICTGRVILQ